MPPLATSLLTLLDDIATVLDDIAVLTKLATRKTAGVLGDDLALNAQQVTGVRAERELPVVWAVAKGSLVNKAILVPAALAISALLPWLITPLLMLGGAYLCYEGCEKLFHKFFHSGDSGDKHAELRAALAEPDVDLVALEKQRIRGAVRTDFVLSAEIIVITLGTVAAAPFLSQVTVLVAIAVIMTAGVYGLVAGIVKLDDLGLYLSGKPGDGTFARAQRGTGRAILMAAPWLMKALSVAGTAAMFLVGGGIIVHGLPFLHHGLEHVLQELAGQSDTGGMIQALLRLVANGALGVIAGALVLAGVSGVKRVLPGRAA